MDNMALTERLEALPSHTSHFKQPESWEIKSLSTWVSAFATYIAVVAGAHFKRVQDMLAYMWLIIREATKYGGLGWATYDSLFRSNRTGSLVSWDELDPSLHILYVVGQRGYPGGPMVPIVMATAVWGPQWAGSQVCTPCDNIAVVAADKSARDPVLSRLLYPCCALYWTFL